MLYAKSLTQSWMMPLCYSLLAFLFTYTTVGLCKNQWRPRFQCIYQWVRFDPSWNKESVSLFWLWSYKQALISRLAWVASNLIYNTVYYRDEVAMSKLNTVNFHILPKSSNEKKCTHQGYHQVIHMRKDKTWPENQNFVTGILLLLRNLGPIFCSCFM